MKRLLCINCIKPVFLLVILFITFGCKDDKVIKGLNMSGQVFFYANAQAEVNISVTDLCTGHETKLVTDSSGRYSLSKLWPGKYKIIPGKRGYYFEPSEITIELRDNSVQADFEQYLTWQSSYARAGFDTVKRIYNIYGENSRVTGYVFAGIKENSISLKNDFVVKKIDLYGNDTWEKSYGEPGIIDNLTDFKKTGDGGYILCGTTEDDLVQGRNIKVIKTDNNGEVEWEFITDNQDDEYARSIDVIDTGSNEYRYIITGNRVLSLVNDDKLSDAILIMLDKDGNELNSSLDIALGSESWDSFNCVRYVDSNRFITAGYSEENTEKKVWIRKYNSFPNLEWQLVGLESIGIYGESEAADFIVNRKDHSSVYLVNFTEDSDEKILVMKLDADKNLAWYSIPATGFTVKGYSISQTGDGGYVVCGSTGSRDFSDIDAVIFRLSAKGEVLWSREWDAGRRLDDTAYFITETYDEGFIVGGSTLSGSTGEDMFINKISREGDVPVDYRAR